MGPLFRVASTQRMYEGRVINLRVDTLDVGNGKTVKREIVEHPGAIVIAALDHQGRVLMVRQYRHAVARKLLELPAGTIESGEDPAATAARELQEETGFQATEMQRLGGFFSAPGFCTEFLHVFIARGLRPSRLQGDEDEEIEVVAMELNEVKRLIVTGEIVDAKTVAGLYLLEMDQGPKGRAG
ncbi:MAG: nudF-B [Dehalococcoidia bacterium]|nr:nudF-B [Dehalococcoidia bacterium]